MSVLEPILRRTWGASRNRRARRYYPDLSALARRHPDVAARFGQSWTKATRENIGRLFQAELDALVRGVPGEPALLRAIEGIAGLVGPTSPLCSAYVAALSGTATEESRRRWREGRGRSLWGVTPIVNIGPAAAADRRAGLDAETVVVTSYYITSDFNVILRGHLEWIQAERPDLVVPFGWLVLTWAVLRFDVFHYFLDRGLLPPTARFGIHPEELNLLSSSGKLLYVYAYGADYRTRERTLAAGRWNFCMDCPEPGRFCVCDEVQGRVIFEQTAAYATSLVATGLSSDYLPGSINTHYFALDLDRFEYFGVTSESSRPLRVVHSPNHAFFKGTRFLEAAVRRLQAEGVPVELVTVSGVSNEEAKRLYGTADLIAEQFIGGIHGYTAIEGMAYGKPVMCYIRDRSLLIDPVNCPIIEANPEQIESRLRHFAGHRDELLEIGRRSREYVERYYTLDAFGRRLASMYRSTPNASPEFKSWIQSTLPGQVPDPAWTPSWRARLAYFADGWLQGILSCFEELPRWPGERLREPAYWVGVARRMRRRIAGLARKGILVGLTLALRGLEAGVVPLARLLTACRLAVGRPRSMWGVTPLVNFPCTARSDRLLGTRAETLVFTTYPVCRDFDVNLQGLSERIALRWPQWYPAFLRLVLLLALLRYDFFHLFLDRGILLPEGGRRFGIHPRELEFLTRSGKRLFTYTYGADVRVRETTIALGRYQLCQGCPEPGSQCICDGALARENVERVRRHATCMCAMGDMLLYVPGARDTAFWPLDLDGIPYHGTHAEEGRPLRVVHASNHPHFKGTVHLERAIAALGEEGVEIELVSLKGVGRAQALDLLASGDVVADQFIAGFHGYTALEGLALGKPVLVYLRYRDTQVAPGECPLINAHPARLQDRLRELSERRSTLAELGWRGREYVERHFSIEAFALRLGRMYLETADLPRSTRERIENALPGIRERVEDRVAAFAARYPRPLSDPTAGPLVSRPARLSAPV